MKKIGNSIILLFFSIAFLFIFSNIVFADQAGCTGDVCLANPLGSNSTITSVLQSIITFLLKIGAPIVGIMVLYGGFLILTAQDSPEKVKQGFDTIKWAAIGYIVVLCAWGIVAIIKEAIGVKP